jgi:two-component system sensor histidine kinase CpxA
LFWKIFLTLWLSIVGFTAAIGLVNDRLAREQWAEEPANTFARGVYQINLRLKKALEQDGRRGVRDELLTVPRMTRSYIYVLDRDNAEILGRDEVLAERADRRIPMDQKVIYDPDGDPFTLYTVNRVPPSTILAPGTAGTVLRLGAAALISALVSFFLARSLTAPLERLRNASRQIAAGNLDTRVGEKISPRLDEIGQLAHDFDNMAERLQHMQKANRRLLRDVSHELRSPLARLSVALEIARKKGADNLVSELNRIELESQRLEELVNDVLGLLRESSETLTRQDEQLDIVTMLKDLVEVVNYEVPEGKPGIDFPGGDPIPFTGDRELLWRAMENLLRNALRHTDADLGVELSAVNAGSDSPVEMIVRDFGTGVPPDEVERIFEPFYRVQEARDRFTGGHGLGLSIASAAVRRHGGEIKAENAGDGGLIVTVTLPPPG